MIYKTFERERDALAYALRQFENSVYDVGNINTSLHSQVTIDRWIRRCDMQKRKLKRIHAKLLNHKWNKGL